MSLEGLRARLAFYAAAVNSSAMRQAWAAADLEWHLARAEYEKARTASDFAVFDAALTRRNSTFASVKAALEAWHQATRAEQAAFAAWRELAPEAKRELG